MGDYRAGNRNSVRERRMKPQSRSRPSGPYSASHRRPPVRRSSAQPRDTCCLEVIVQLIYPVIGVIGVLVGIAIAAAALKSSNKKLEAKTREIEQLNQQKIAD